MGGTSAAHASCTSRQRENSERRRAALPRDANHWSLTRPLEKRVKLGAKVTPHSKYVTFQLAGVAVTLRLFAAILDRITRLATPPTAGAGSRERRDEFPDFSYR
jgi:hypothetical protein